MADNVQRKKGQRPLREVVSELDGRLGAQLQRVWHLAEEGIHDAQRSKDGHQQGTAHCRAVEENLSALIPDEWKGTQFGALDLFVLSAAAALHDVGKAGDLSEDHGRVSMWEVRDRAETFGLDQGQAEVVGWVVGAHNDADLGSLPDEPIPLGTADVDVRSLAALLKLADALHTHYGRVSRQVVEFGGRRAEDSPKTRFRMRVRGWRFNNKGQVELYAVPKDWDDVSLIHTGYEMTRRELEPIAATLQASGLPWELTLRRDESDLEQKAVQEVEAEQRVERAFVGMDYFTEADTLRFKGRDDDIQTLWRRVMAMPISLLIGESGVGKTSLIHAGLFPLLHRAQWRTVYTRPLDDPDRHIVRDLWHELLAGEPPADVTIVDTLSRACRALGGCKALVVLDQFEDVVRMPLPEALEGLRRAMVAVQAGRFRDLRLLVSYRADAEASAGLLLQGIAGSGRVLRSYLQPLDRAGARDALDAGFAEAQVGVDEELLDIISDELEAQTPVPGVYPPYVQMVGEVLCQAAHEENEGILTTDLYQEQDGCAGIIGRYLLQRLAKFGDQEEGARQVLVALVRSTGVKGQRSPKELQAETGLDASVLAQLLDELVNRRMIRHLSGGQYEIIHDHLALFVDQIIDNEERELKELQELLALRARTYTANHIPLQSPDLARLYAVREQIVVDSTELRLLLHSCLLDRGPAWFWLRETSKAAVGEVLRDALARPVAELRTKAARVLVQLMGREAIRDLREMLKDRSRSMREVAMQALVQLAGKEDIPDLRKMLKDGDQHVRSMAVQALVQLAGREAISDLRKMLRDRARSVREAVVQAFAKVADRQAILGLREMLRDEDSGVREAAVQALVQLAGREAISDLREMLGDRDQYVCEAAAQALVQLASREDIPDLREMLRDTAGRVRRVAAQALAKVAGRDDISALRKLLTDGDPSVRYAAAQALVQLASREDLPDLREMLRDEDWRVRNAAVRALTRVAGTEAIPDLGEMLSDQVGSVREAVVQAFAKVADRQAILGLREMLRDEDSGVREAAVQALVQLAGREAISDLREMLGDRDQYVCEAAAQALVQLASREDIPDLREMLEDEDWNVREAAAQTLEKVAGREDSPYLRKLLKDKVVSVRRVAMQALVKVAGGESIPDLREMLRDEDSSVREAAVQALVNLSGREAIPELCEMLRDRARSVRYASAQALVQLAGREDIPNLREMLRDRARGVRYAATQALAKVAGREAIPDLREMLRDRAENVRYAATQALGGLVTEVDLEWLVERSTRPSLAPIDETVMQLLIDLDYKLYFEPRLVH